MATPQMTNTTTSTLDEATKRYQAAQQGLMDATQAHDAAVAEINNRPYEPGTGYDEIFKSLEPEKPTTVIDPQKEKSRMWITNIADAINAVGGIIGAANGADVVPATSLSAVNQQRYNKLMEQRKAEQDAYNRALMQTQSHAMSLADAYRRQRQQEDARLIAQEDAKLNRAKLEYDLANDTYTRARQQEQDAYNRQRNAESDARSDSRYWQERQDKEVKNDEAYDKDELNKYEKVS